MKSSLLKSYFLFSKSQRSGLVALIVLIILLQAIYFFVDFRSVPQSSPDNTHWLSLQTEIDSLKQEKLNYQPKIYPFNPNFITDFKGYKLGMSVAEIDRLLAFRKQNKYVNSAAGFQAVTHISDSLLNAISPYFKFPDWVTNKDSKHDHKTFTRADWEQKKTIVIKDINQATQEDLMKIYGIGPAISDRILKQKELLGGFVSMQQMQDVWGLSPEVIEKLEESFIIRQQPQVKKIKINDASVKELAQFPYFRYALAKQIVTYRSMHGQIHNTADLIKINGFPLEKAEIIALYLEF
ncbi:MAG TPA: helix-hairpin-helix domain-containing protein [Flavobacterium sp.]|jgi:DNA uptake protein ComE-like DNA-binding protein